MLIRSIRLQNIKSFASGPDGQGVRVAFERGLNRLAGPNGAGKSTLIEALGYALFDHSPETHARLDLDTLLLRSGAKEGEIEVEIETPDGRYFVRRGVGKQSKTRWTVRDAGGFVTHETEDEVRRFLAAAAGLPAPEALPDLFRKLVGVRQGRMLDPFELTPTEARKHFAPILDVEIYQRCFTDLLEPARILEREVHEEVRKRDVARAQAELLAGAPQEAERLSARLAEMEGALHAARHALAKAREDLAVHEARERAIPEAKSALEAARKAVETADRSLVEKREWLQRAEQARKVLEAHAEAHRAYVASQEVFAALAEERKQFEGARERAANLKQQLAAAQAKAQESDRQARAQLDEIEKRTVEGAKRKESYEQRKAVFEKAQAGASAPEAPETLRRAREALNGAERWAAGLQAALEGARQAGKDAAEANRKLANFDPQVVQRANAARDAARAAHEAKKTEHTELEARRKSRREMSHVLEQSRHCPLMAERCKQFDAGKLVLSEVQLDETLDDLRKETAATEAALKKAEAAAEAAQRDLDGTRDTRVTADRALKELGRHLEFARQPDSVEAWKAAAAAFAPAGSPPLDLPGLLELPHPGMDPWKALEAAGAVANSFCVFAEGVNASVAKWAARLDERQQASQDRSRKREQEAHELSVEAQRMQERDAELVRARQAQEQSAARTHEALKSAEALAKSLEDLTARVASLDALEVRAAEAETRRAEFADGHRAYVAAEADAARLEQTRGDVAVAVGDLERARAQATAAFQARDKAIAAYDAPGHARARKALEETAGQVMAMERDLTRDREQLEEAQRRVKQLQQARDGWSHSEARRALLDARRELLEHARRTLRDAGPKVAEHLVQAVNGRAQRIFSALSPNDPGQLDWQSDYELRVATSNGVRRFSMLSGGQKVKAALAIQLALIQQFSEAGLCVFDEPTYALDAESRGLLAEAIADAQSLTKFEQLFVVSHDDAFDGHVEHTVALAYAPASGSSVA
ncbi:MAG: SMC family ATPase [Planctomycetota bacterium]|nr:SMC family ATPase [Planctomycetota bacterium]